MQQFTPDELKTMLFELTKQFDMVTEELSLAEGDFRKLDKLEKSVMAVLKNTSQEKTESGKEREALCHPRYKEWITKWSDAQRKFFNLKAKKEGLEQRIKATISVLSYEKIFLELGK